MSNEPARQDAFWRWEQGLLRLLAARDRKDAERQFERMYESLLAAPIDRVLREEIGGDIPTTPEALWEEHDIFTDLSLLVRGRIAARLLHLWEEGHLSPTDSPSSRKSGISNLYGYVVIATRNACVDYLRQEYPGRHSLDNSLRAALARHPQLKIWKVTSSEGYVDWRCGRPEWYEAQVPPVDMLSNGFQRIDLRAALDGLSQADALMQVFEIARAPVHFVQLLNFLSDYWDVERAYRQAEQESVPFQIVKSFQSGFQPEEILGRLATLQRVWGSVERLSPHQAAVLLFKAPQYEVGSVLDAMVDFGVADWFDLAAVTGLSAEKLREISDDIPMEDREIADLLFLEPEDVPRVRQDARRRLSRQNERQRRLEESRKDATTIENGGR